VEASLYYLCDTVKILRQLHLQKEEHFQKMPSNNKSSNIQMWKYRTCNLWNWVANSPASRFRATGTCLYFHASKQWTLMRAWWMYLAGIYWSSWFCILTQISCCISPGKVKPQIMSKARNVQAGQPLHILVVVTCVMTCVT